MYRICIRLLITVAATLAYAPGLFFPIHVNAAPPPPILHHQSVIHVDGSPFEGAGTFKFALVSADGLTTYWSHDGTSTGGAPPTSSLTLNVAGGRYAVQLGAAPMAPIPAVLFSTYNDAHLRTWFDDGINGSELLFPDRPLAAGAYAWHAATADQVTDGAITTVSFAPGTIASLAWGRSGNAGMTAGTDFIGTTDDVPLEFRVDNREILTMDRDWNWFSGSNHQLLGGQHNWALGTDHEVSNKSVAHGHNNTVSDYSYGFGQKLKASSYSMSVGRENNASNHSFAFGKYNDANDYGFAGGHRARAFHPGSFVWSDSIELETGGSSAFATTAPYQFLIDAAGGVGINTNAPATALDVNGTVTATAFVGDASGLSGIESVAWGRSGNAGTVAGTDFIGTIDDVPLEVRVDNRKILTLDRDWNWFSGSNHQLLGGDFNWALGTDHEVRERSVAHGHHNSIFDYSYGFGRDLTASSYSMSIGRENHASSYSFAFGQHNAAHDYSFAGGLRARALHPGSFVWSDSIESTTGGSSAFATTAPYQFLIDAGGGVGINTNAPATALDVNGTVTATALNAGTISATTLDTGTVTATALNAGTISATTLDAGTATATALDVDGTVTATGFAGDGSELSGLDSIAWSRSGNAGTVAGTDFIGTIDDVPMEFRVNNRPVMKLESSSHPLSTFVPTVVLGDNHDLQYPAPDPSAAPVEGNFIHGSDNAIIASHVVDPIDGEIAYAEGFNFVLGSGNWMEGSLGHNIIVGKGHRLSVLPGVLFGFSDYNAMLGGLRNTSEGSYNGLIGGHDNRAVDLSFVGGGKDNQAHYGSFVGGGYFNVAKAESFVGGGYSNEADAYSFVGGGNDNQADAYSFVGGGYSNEAVDHSFVGGGYSNEAVDHSFVAGGFKNHAEKRSFAAGQKSEALHPGTFVWSDSSEAVSDESGYFRSTAPHQFLIEAQGGVGINTNTPATALDVNGTVSATALDVSGTVSATALDVSGTVSATAFVGDASELSGIDSVAWGRSGNAGTVAGTDFIGTTDVRPLEFRVNDEQAMRIDHALDPNSAWSAFNLILGNEHTVDPVAYGVTIGGGVRHDVSSSAGYATIGGGDRNSITEGSSGTIGGGTDNVASEDHATVPGGRLNSALGVGSFAAGRQATAAHHGSFVWSDGLGLQSTGSNQFLIGASGGVGINTNTPATALDVNGTVTASAVDVAGTVTASAVDVAGTVNSSKVRIAPTGEGVEVNLVRDSVSYESNVRFVGGGKTYHFGTPQADRMRLWVEDAGEVWTVLPNGKVGINKTAPTEALDVGGIVHSERIVVTEPSEEPTSVVLAGADGRTTYRFLNFSNGQFEIRNSDVGAILVTTSAGHVGIGGGANINARLYVHGRVWAKGFKETSSRRLKENIETIDNAVDTVGQLRGVRFDWKDDGHPDIGLIAEEVGQVIPEVVTYEENGVDAQSVSYTSLVAVLIEAVKEQQQTIENQSKALAKVQQQVDMLLEAHHSREER